MQDTCRMDGCSRPIRYKKAQLCAACYQKRREVLGNKNSNTPRFPVGTTCRMDDCDEPVSVRKWQLCKAHYAKFQIYGDPSMTGAKFRGTDQSTTTQAKTTPINRPEGADVTFVQPRRDMR